MTDCSEMSAPFIVNGLRDAFPADGPCIEGDKSVSSQQSLASVADPRHLPTPPAASLELVRLSRDQNAGVGDMAAALLMDAGLAAKIIATANSAIYRRDREATTVERAIGQIGVRGVVTLALAHSVTAQLPSDGKLAGLDLAQYWRRSLVSAVATRALVPALDAEAFLVGLLANLGKVAMARSHAGAYEALVETCGGWPSLDAETETFGHNALDVTAAALDTWEMPALFSAAIRKCSDGTIQDREDSSKLAQALTVALEIAAFAEPGAGGEQLKRVHDAVERVSLAGVDVEAFVADLGPAVAEGASALAMPFNEQDYDAMLDDARAQLVDLTLQADVDRQREHERAEQLEFTNRELEQQALRDSLTGLSNRLAFDQSLEQHVRLRMREPEMYTKPLGVVMIDIDHFKAVNDTHGHPIGDEVLKQLGLVLQMMCRTEETVARYGGEEFVLVAPIAAPDDLMIASERIRKAVELIEVSTPNGALTVTASLGGACIENVVALHDGRRVLEAADEQLYNAKNGGRNQTQVRPEPLQGQQGTQSL